MLAHTCHRQIRQALRPPRDRRGFRHELVELDDANCRVLRALHDAPPEGRDRWTIEQLSVPLKREVVTARIQALQRDGLICCVSDTRWQISSHGLACFRAEAERRAAGRRAAAGQPLSDVSA